MNRIKNLITYTGLAACVAVSLAAANPASAGTVVYATDFNSALSGTQVPVGSTTPFAPIAANGSASSNYWNGSNSGVTAASTTGGKQYGFLNATGFGDSTYYSPVFTATAGTTYTLTTYMEEVEPFGTGQAPTQTNYAIASTGPSLGSIIGIDAQSGPITGLNAVGSLGAANPTLFTAETISFKALSSGTFDVLYSQGGYSTLLLSGMSLTAAPAPEASTVIGLGVMLALGGLFMVASRKRTVKDNLAV